MWRGMAGDMKVLVTGAAGFIGSSISERLLGDGADVRGIDMFTDNYSVDIKRNNINILKKSAGFEFTESNILDSNLAALLDGVDVVYHQAAIPGVRDSWGKRFEDYVNNNVLATQKLLEAAKGAGLKKFVYASSSSIYGDAESFPTSETAVPKPMSPYGVTKLSAEHLCLLYSKNHGVPCVALRYFTVYGPRQRQDMAFHKILRAAFLGEEFLLFGDGSQTRDFTFIKDAVAANLGAAEDGVPGTAYNIGGGSRVSMNEVLDIIAKITGTELRIKKVETQKGDVRDTSADTSLARRDFGYAPAVGLEEGLSREWEWIKELYG